MTLRPAPLRPLRFLDGACIIELTQGHVAFVDAADAYLIADGDHDNMKAGIEAISRDMMQRVGSVERSVYREDLH